MTDLLPCPFCSGEAELDDLLDMFTTHFSCGHYGIGMARWFKHCPECGAKVVEE